MSLIKNSAFNIFGYVLPTIIAIPALGYMARALGHEAFGIYTLAMALVGYAGIFDAGLTRAVIREISLNRKDSLEKQRVISTSVFGVVLLGLLGASLLFLFSDALVRLLSVENKIAEQVSYSIKVLSISIPLFLLNQIWLAALEGEERFLLVNVQRSIGNVFLVAIPAFFVFTNGPFITNAIYGLVLGRLIALFLNVIFSYKVVISSWSAFNKATFIRLLRYGGWITISNIISPLMSYFDRFIVSHITGAASVAFYSGPSEAVARMALVPSALSRAVFPKLSSIVCDKERKRLERRAITIIAIVCIPMVSVFTFFANDILGLWLGQEFKGKSGFVFQILLLGFLFNCFAQIPYSSLQAQGKSKTTAFIHLCEVLPYLLMLFFLVNKFSIVGAAFAWTTRMAVDCLILFLVSKKLN